MLTSSVAACTENVVLRLVGVLDDSTYGRVRDAVIKAAIDRPGAVIIDIDGLKVRSDRALAVFTSARWHVRSGPMS